MRSTKSLAWVFVLLPLVACRSKLPVRTSLGELYRMKKVQSVNTDTAGATDIRLMAPKTISAQKGDTLVVLYFRGTNHLEFKAPSELPAGSCVLDSSRRTPLEMLPCLEDSPGRNFFPGFKGTDTADGTLSTKGWQYDNGGFLTGSGWGTVVFVGSVTTPESHFAMVYSVPKDAKSLKLNDQGRVVELE
jgi:hypothetical protein